MTSAVPKGLKVVSAFVASAAKKLSPVGETGNLRGSIIWKLIGKTGARVGTGVHYAPHVEFGTVKMGAQPYLRPAVQKNLAKISALFRKAFGGVVK